MIRPTAYSYSHLNAAQRARLSQLIPPNDPGPRDSKTSRSGSYVPARHSPSSTLSRVAQQHAAVLKHFREREFDGVAVTLTFKSGRFPEYLSEEVAEAAVRELIKRLNKFANGRHRPNLQVIAVREGGTGRNSSTRLHYHLKIEVPPGISAENFAKKVEQYWTRLRWASRDQNRVVPKTDHGWVSYILKTRSKPDYADAIDWQNTQVPPHPVAECTGGG
ncbi:hypothetical protein [Stenotrophomonas sp. HMSC10F06]|uniref:rolling circle replication-associated protein n=1 Tax=Stenotrophomonas sp. HMSC10F06 TaxID=1581081 RepID=UPI001113170A|nr:hypothetical protein [Stenotrophomonas sp. HMSC10F06]